MIVDGKGNLFEDRRKNKNGKRNEIDENGKKIVKDRRKAPQQITKSKKK